MGLLEHAFNGVKHFAEDPVGATKRFLDLNFGDGSVGGTNPAQIHSWFYDGPGTGDYDDAKATLDDLSGSYQRASSSINSTKQQLAANWKGTASEAAQAHLGKMTSELDSMHQASTATSQQLGSQSGTFNGTKHKVQQVPNKPPDGGGLSTLNPATAISGATSDLAVADYQEKARQNQAAYHGYGQGTQPQQQALPREQAPVIQPAPDTGVDEQHSGAGHSGNVAAPATHDSGGGDRGATPNGPGYAPSNYQHHVSQNPGSTSTQGVTGNPVRPAPPVGGGTPSPIPPGGSTGVTPPGPPPFRGFPGAPGVGGTPGTTAGIGELAGGAAVAGGAAAGGYGSDSVRGRNGSWSSRGRGFSAGSEEGAGGRSGSGKAGFGKASFGKAGSSMAGEREGAGARAGARAAAAAAEAEERALARGAARGGPGSAGVPGARGKKEDDKEHKTASYLIHEQHGEELVGKIEPVAPEVLGESPEERERRHQGE